MSKLYDQDFYGWANDQAGFLHAGNLHAADIPNVAEEIDSIGKTIRNELVNRLVVLLQHLLKREFQPGLRNSSWDATIAEQRDRIAGHIGDNPSLKPRIPDAMLSAYRVARIRAAGQTGLPRHSFRAEYPYDFASVIGDGFWPGRSLDARP